MRTGIISQVRMGSTRLPGKVLLKAGDDSLLGWHVRRLQQTSLPVLLATTTNSEDDVLVEFARAHHIPITRGDANDVLSRFQQCAAEHDLDAIIRVTSDCPLIAPELINRGFSAYQAAADPGLYLSNVLHRTYPRGFDFEIFSRQLLEEAAAQATRPEDREHVTPYLHQNRPGTIQMAHLTRQTDASAYRLTVDTAADFALIQVLLDTYGAGQLDAEALIALLEVHPELVALNAHVEQKKI